MWKWPIFHKNLQMPIKWKILKISKRDYLSPVPKIYSYSIVLFLVSKVDSSKQKLCLTKNGLQNNIIDRWQQSSLKSVDHLFKSIKIPYTKFIYRLKDRIIKEIFWGVYGFVKLITQSCVWMLATVRYHRISP